MFIRDRIFYGGGSTEPRRVLGWDSLTACPKILAEIIRPGALTSTFPDDHVPAWHRAGHAGADGQRVRVLGAKDPLADLQQRGVLVASSDRIPHLHGRASEVGADGQRIPVLDP
jgi:hypothetical protein